MLFGLCLDYPVVEIECEKFEREYDLRVIPLSKAVDLHLKVFLNWACVDIFGALFGFFFCIVVGTGIKSPTLTHLRKFLDIPSFFLATSTAELRLFVDFFGDI